MLKLRIKFLDLVERLVLEIDETDDDVRDLNAGVVDIVLHLDPLAVRLQDPLERVAEDRVSHMADVRGFVRIDRRVLDADLDRGL